MNFPISIKNYFGFRFIPQWATLCGIILVFCGALHVSAQPQISQADDKTLIIEDAPEMEVFAFGKTVIIKKHAKGVLSFGGDVIIEGEVTGDVATVGGSVTQKENAFIGGDVIVFGGVYRPESATAKRAEGKETVVFGVFEEEFRRMAQDPTQIFSPDLSISFFVSRILSILFWFIVSFAFATIAPGAVSRAVARFQLSTLKIFAIGFFAFVLTMITSIGSLSVLPNYLSAVVYIMIFALLLLAYIFGRVTLQVSLGKFLQKTLFKEKTHSEALAIFLGVTAWTLILSIPYVWTLGLLALFAAGIGLTLTARTNNKWEKP